MPTIPQATHAILSNGERLEFPAGINETEVVRLYRQKEEEIARRDLPISNPNLVDGPTSTVTGMTPFQAQSRAEAGLEAAKPALALGTRIAGPALAAVGAPAVIPASAGALSSFTLGSLIGSFSNTASELLAQNVEQINRDKTDVNYGKLGGAAIYGLNPLRTTGTIMSRVGVNVPTTIGQSELGRFIENGKEKYTEEFAASTLPDFFLRFGTPAGMAGIGSVAGGVQDISREAQAGIKRKQRMMPGARVMPGEAIPDFIPYDQAAINAGSRLAISLYEDLGTPIGQKIEAALPNIPEILPLKRRLMDDMSLLESSQARYLNAQRKAQEAAQRAQDAAAAGAAEAAQLEGEARLAALEATSNRIFLRSDIRKSIGAAIGSNTKDYTFGARDLDMKQLLDDVDGFLETTISSTYKRAGYNINDPVVSLGDVEFTLAQAAKNPDNPLHHRQTYEKILADTRKYFADNGVEGKLDLGSYRNFRNAMYDSRKGALGESSSNLAHAQAAVAYDAVRDAADNYILKTNPNAFQTWKTANALVASRSAAFDNPTYELMMSGGNISTSAANKLVEGIMSQGNKGRVMRDVTVMSEMIAAMANPADPASRETAAAAADAFKGLFNDAVRDTLLTRSSILGSGQRASDYIMDAFDVNKLVKELDTLERVGFPIADLKLGSPNQIRSYARMLDITGKATATDKDISQFLTFANEFGEKDAAWLMEYRDALTSEMIARGPGAKAQAQARKVQALNNFKLTEDQAKKALDDALSNPIVAFLNDPNTRASNFSANSLSMGMLMSLEPSVLKDLTKSLSAAGRLDDLETLRVAAAASVMRQFEPAANGKAEIANLRALNEFFYGQNEGEKRARQAMRSLLGDDRYRNLERAFGQPIKERFDYRQALDANASNSRLVAIRQRIPIGTTRGYAQSDSNVVSDLLARGRFNAIYKMFIDPNWRDEFAQASGAIDMAINKTPALRSVLAIANDDDERQKAARMAVSMMNYGASEGLPYLSNQAPGGGGFRGAMETLAANYLPASMGLYASGRTGPIQQPTQAQLSQLQQISASLARPTPGR